MIRVSPHAGFAWISVFAFFSLALIIGKTGNFSFYLLMLAALTHAVYAVKQRDFGILGEWKKYRWVYVSAAGIALAILAHEIAGSNVRIRSYDVPSRLAFLALLTWGALSLSTRQMKSLRWAFPIGVLLATIKLVKTTSFGDMRIAVIDFTPIIAFSELALLLAIFAVFSIVWSDRRSTLATVVLGFTGLVGLYNIYISQTRGAWIAIPIFIVLICIVFSKNARSLKTVAWSLILIIALGGAFGTTDLVRKRVDQAVSDIHQYTDNNNSNTSVGIRFQLWKASWILFAENPVFGVGRDKFEGSLKTMAESGVITAEASTYPHSHNEVLFNMTTFGLFGLLGILATYFVPLYYFARDMRHVDREIAATAAMGVSLCIGYFIFGLVDVMFMWRICDIFYSLSIAFFLAFIIRKKYELQKLAVLS